jgi:uncharacterized protein (DUF4415 family)
MALVRRSSDQIKKYLENPSKEDILRLKKLKNMKDADIDTSDIPELTEVWFKKVKLIKPNNKVTKTIRFNKDVIDFVQKKQGKGYQTLINDIVEQWAKHHGM